MSNKINQILEKSKKIEHSTNRKNNFVLISIWVFHDENIDYNPFSIFLVCHFLLFLYLLHGITDCQ